jgi:phage gp29-like protein
MAKLYDAYGNLVDTGLLKEELAAPGIGTVRQVMSSHPSADLTPGKLGRLLRDSENGDATAYLELAEDMEEKYMHYGAQLRTRKLACAGLDVNVKAAGDSSEDQTAADLVRDALDNVNVREAVTDALDGLGKGYSVLEIMWDTSGRQWLPAELAWRDPRWFRFDVFDGVTLLLLDGGYGSPLAPYKFIYHRPKLKSGLPIKGGLARAAAWSFLFSQHVLKDWVGFCEVYGQPIRVGKYPIGTTEDNRSVLKRAVDRIGSDCSAVIPDGMLIEFVEAATKNATGELYNSLCHYLDDRVTIAILGQTLTSGQTQGGGGSMALGKVHNEVRYDLLEADASQLSATLTQQLARPLVDLNLGPRKKYPKIELFIKQETDLTALADQLSKLVPLGLRVRQEEIRAKFGFTDPEEGAEILTAPQPTMQGFSRQMDNGQLTMDNCGGQGNGVANLRCNEASARQCGNGYASAGISKKDVVDALSDQLENEAGDALDGLIEPIKRLVASANSYDEVIDGLGAMYPEMDDDTFAKIVGEALLAANLAGAATVRKPNG